MKPIYFADKQLEERIRKELLELEGDIFPDDVASIESLHISFYDDEIFDISPLLEFKALKDLGLYNIKITDITPLAGLVNLTHLEVFGSEITDITPLAGLVNLTNLKLVGGGITDISFLAGLVNLTDLDLSYNNIADITPLAELVNLINLKLNDNQITDITSLKGLVNLTNLNLCSNSITDIRFLAGLVNLTYLNLSFNNIADITSVAELVNLTGLYLPFNNIADITPVAELVNLTYLSLFSNNFVDISPLAGLVNLTYLTLDFIYIKDFTPLKGLEKLILNGGLVLKNSYAETSFYLRYWPKENIRINILDSKRRPMEILTIHKSNVTYCNKLKGYPFKRTKYTRIRVRNFIYQKRKNTNSWITINLVDSSLRQIIIDDSGIYLEVDLLEEYDEWRDDGIDTVKGYGYLEFDSFDSKKKDFVFICKTEGFVPIVGNKF